MNVGKVGDMDEEADTQREERAVPGAQDRSR